MWTTSKFFILICFRVFRVSKTVSWLIAHWIPDSLVCDTPLINWYYRWLLVNWVKLYVCLRLCFKGNVWNQCTWVDFSDKRISKPQIYALIIDIQWTSSLSDTRSRSISIRQSIQIYLISKSIVQGKSQPFLPPKVTKCFQFSPPSPTSPFGNNEYELAKIKSTQLEKMRDCATKC